MDLFSNSGENNLLPYDGTAIYLGALFPPDKAAHYFDKLLDDIEWRHDEAVIFGKRIITKRKVAWYGDVAYA